MPPPSPSLKYVRSRGLDSGSVDLRSITGALSPGGKFVPGVSKAPSPRAESLNSSDHKPIDGESAVRFAGKLERAKQGVADALTHRSETRCSGRREQERESIPT